MTENESSQQENSSSTTLTKQQRQLLNSRIIASQFGNIVTILMQSPAHKNVRLPDLYSLVVPPLLTNQFRLAEAVRKESGTSLPVGLVLWARVSDDIHQRLCEQVAKPIILAPKEWNSGENYWIVDAIGPERFVAPLLSGLRQGDLKGKKVHYRAKSSEGPEVRTMGPESSEGAGEAKNDSVSANKGNDSLNGQHATG